MLIIKISKPATLKHTYNNTSALHKLEKGFQKKQ